MLVGVMSCVAVCSVLVFRDHVKPIWCYEKGNVILNEDDGTYEREIFGDN